MPYTALRVTDKGIVLFTQHARRLESAGPGALLALRQLAATGKPGVYAIWADDGGTLRIEARGGSRLHDGMPVRWQPSPLAMSSGAQAKAASPNLYDAVREPGIATLLTSSDGMQIHESCSAAVLGWDGDRLVCVPADTPRIWSTAETAVRENMPTRNVPLPVDDPSMPLVLVNAVKGVCTIDVPGRAPFPKAVVQQLEALFARLTE